VQCRSGLVDGVDADLGLPPSDRVNAGLGSLRADTTIRVVVAGSDGLKNPGLAALRSGSPRAYAAASAEG
jgi:hypothetical protein